MHVWLNGKFLPRDEATIPVFDAGFQHGVGLFETMLARNGRIFRPRAHLERLKESATELLLTERLQIDPLIEALHTTLEKNGLQDVRVRLTLTGGNLNLLQTTGRSAVDPTLLIVAQPPTEYPDAFFADGVTAMIADGRDNPFSPMAGHKTLNYWPRIRALQVANSRRASEALWFTVSNHLASGSVSNAFFVRDGVLFTPIARGEEQKGALPSCVLPGITRAAVIELAESMEVEVRKEMLDIEQLLKADEVFLTNSSWGVLPVVRIEREEIATAMPGALTMRLREKWLQLVDDETQEAAKVDGDA